MPAIYVSGNIEDRELLNQLTREHGCTAAALIRALLRQHGKQVAAKIGRAQAALRGAVDGKRGRS